MSGLALGAGVLFKGAAGAAAAGGLGGVATGGLAAGAAGAAGGIFGGGGLGIIGSVLGGIGRGMMMKAEMRERERQQIAEEERREARYAGSGEATRFWEGGNDIGTVGQIGPREEDPVGQAERVGEQYTGLGATAPQLNPAPARAPTYTYDRNTGRLVTA